MTTENNNKLIAEFLGWRESIIHHQGKKYDYELPSTIEMIGESDLHYCSDCGNDLHYKHSIFLNEMLFHSSWNWLMEVVEKIEDLNYSIEMNKQEENDYQCLIIKKDIKVQTFSEIKIQAVYQAVIQFITWYNQQQK